MEQSNLTEEEINFMDRYGVGKIFNDLSKTKYRKFYGYSRKE